MLVPWQSLREKIRDVVVARDMLDAELVALDTVLQPMKTHVDRFGAFLLDLVCDDTDRTCVVTHKNGRGLRVPKIS